MMNEIIQWIGKNKRLENSRKNNPAEVVNYFNLAKFLEGLVLYPDSDLIERVRHLINCYEQSQFERPAAVYMTKEELSEIISIMESVDHDWGYSWDIEQSAHSNVGGLFHCRIELQKGGDLCALTRDERGLTKVIVCLFCNGAMVGHTPRVLLEAGGTVTQYECQVCYVIWPTDQWIKEQTEAAVKTLKQSIKDHIGKVSE